MTRTRSTYLIEMEARELAGDRLPIIITKGEIGGFTPMSYVRGLTLTKDERAHAERRDAWVLTHDRRFGWLAVFKVGGGYYWRKLPECVHGRLAARLDGGMEE